MKHQITKNDLQSITAILSAEATSGPNGISFETVSDEFRNRGYSIEFLGIKMGTLFNYWAKEGEIHLLQAVAFEFAYELEERRTAQRRMKKCFQDLLNLD